jgi:hypothetical protein
MVPSGVAEIVELIWHFAGHLRIQSDGVARVKINYEGTAPKILEDENTPTPADKSSKPLPVDIDSDASPVAILPDADDYSWHVDLRHFSDKLGKFPDLPKTGAKPQELPPFHPMAGGGGGGGGSSSVEFTFTFKWPGPLQEIVDLKQINTLHDNDQASVGPLELELAPIDAAPVLAPMLDDAQNAVPASFEPEHNNSSSVLEFVNARDSHPVETQTEDAPYLVAAGKYVNGELQDPDTDVHQITNERIDAISAALDAVDGPPPLPPGDHSGMHIQEMSLGSNITANDASVTGHAGLCGSMLVLGDTYQVQAIFQTNVLVQSDQFEVHSGGEGGINFMPNLVQNIADISTTGAIEGPWEAGGPLFWQVDVINGSFYNVNCMTQTNYISDNDTVSQTQSFGLSFVMAGSNDQINSIDLTALSSQYDLIVIEGSYHRLDMINQTNVVLDLNHVWQDGTGSAAADQNIAAGNNTLINDASIVYLGSTGSQAVTDEMLELAKVLAGGTQPGDSLIESAFPTLMGAVHVLYVQGDYYDINYLAQTNIISDADAAAQLLTSDSGEQSISTGNNQALNVANIIDAGSLTTPYVQGQAYSDTILIQTNIISTDHQITTNDPAQLVPELVAFTGNDDADQHQQTDAPQLFAPADSQQHNDVLAGTLH